MATPVKFRLEPFKEIVAIFPNENYNRRLYGTDVKTVYSHIGQHSSASKDYIKSLKPATPEQYKELKEELESLGYQLKICK